VPHMRQWQSSYSVPANLPYILGPAYYLPIIKPLKIAAGQIGFVGAATRTRLITDWPIKVGHNVEGCSGVIVCECTAQYSFHQL
jgi:hypothetical protein